MEFNIFKRMVLNYLWVFFFFAAFLTALGRLVFAGDMTIFSDVINSVFDMSRTAFEISLGLTGILSLWLGIMKIGEKAGIIQVFARIVKPFFSKLFPEIPVDHPVYGSMVMNFAANMLGLDNAATPMGLKTMKQLQELNPSKSSASNAQIMFLVLNTSGLTLIPISVMVYRAQMGAANPSDVFLPILLATFFSTLTGLVGVSLFQKINLLQKAIILPIVGLCTAVGAILYAFQSLPQEQVQVYSTLIANLILFGIIILFLGMGVFKRINVYDAFIDGAKEGFQVAITIIPYLIAILVAIAAFRSSGAMNYVVDGVKYVIASAGFNTEFVEALPTAMMKPLSGSGARGMMVDTMKTFGADSFVGRLSSVFQGSTDTTFYIIAVYFGSVGIRQTRHAVPFGLLADGAGIIAAIFISYLFFA